jgi:hypothetical protein
MALQRRAASQQRRFVSYQASVVVALPVRRDH